MFVYVRQEREWLRTRAAWVRYRYGLTGVMDPEASRSGSKIVSSTLTSTSSFFVLIFFVCITYYGGRN